MELLENCIKLLKKKKGDKGKTQLMGTEVRFKDPKKSKSSLTVNVPGAGHYPLISEWPGKIVKPDDKKKKNWMYNLTKGVEKSIYY